MAETAILTRPGSLRTPLLALPIRLLGVCLFLGLAVWAKTLIWLGAAGVGAIGFRFWCGLPGTGLAREIGAAAWFTLMWGILAAWTSTWAGFPEQMLEVFLRMFLVLAPALAFSRSLDTRELGWYFQAILPPAMLLGLEIALRFVPILCRELTEVFAIQRARGVFRAGGLVLGVRALFFPFFLRLFRIADRVAYGLQCRRIQPEQVPCRVSPERVRQIVHHGFQEESPCPVLSRELSAPSQLND